MKIRITPEIFENQFGELFLKSMYLNKDSQGDSFVGYRHDEGISYFILWLTSVQFYEDATSIVFNTKNQEKLFYDMDILEKLVMPKEVDEFGIIIGPNWSLLKHFPGFEEIK